MNTDKTNSLGAIEARNVYRCVSIIVPNEPHKRDPWERQLVKAWGSQEAVEWDASLMRCKGCGCHLDTTPTTLRAFGADVPMPVTVCDECMELVRDHYDHGHKPQEVTATPEWDQHCPPRFQDAVLAEELPSKVDRAGYDRVMRWADDPSTVRGPLMSGKPGTGKTTTFWALARKLEQAGHSPKCLSSVELGRILSTAAKDVREVSWLYNSRVLMVDDLGKEKLTPAVASLLWEVLDRRYGLGHPLVVTTQFSGQQMESRFGEEHLGQSIRRRLNEVCFQVQFNQPATVTTNNDASTHRNGPRIAQD